MNKSLADIMAKCCVVFSQSPFEDLTTFRVRHVLLLVSILKSNAPGQWNRVNEICSTSSPGIPAVAVVALNCRGIKLGVGCWGGGGPAWGWGLRKWGLMRIFRGWTGAGEAGAVAEVVAVVVVDGPWQEAAWAPTRARTQVTLNCLILMLTHWGETKWPTFGRRHFQTYFWQWKCLNFN